MLIISFKVVFLPEISSCSKGFRFCNGEHAKKSLSATEVVVPNGSVVLLSCRVEDVDLDLFSIQNHLFSVAVSFSGLIVFHKLERDQHNYTLWSTSIYTNDVKFQNIKSYLIIHELQC